MCFWGLRPNAVSETILISHGSNLWSGEKTGAVAFALVLRHNAQDVRERSYAGESADAVAWPSVGRCRDGSWSRPQTTYLVALYPIGTSPRRGTHRLPVLNRHQFCRGQKSRFKR